MKAFLLSFLVGLLVGVLYAAMRVRSPAPPLVALTGAPRHGAGRGRLAAGDGGDWRPGRESKA